LGRHGLIFDAELGHLRAGCDLKITMTKQAQPTLPARSTLRVRSNVRAGGFDTAGAVK
jgi:hypothetical protein